MASAGTPSSVSVCCTDVIALALCRWADSGSRARASAVTVTKARSGATRTTASAAVVIVGHGASAVLSCAWLEADKKTRRPKIHRAFCSMVDLANLLQGRPSRSRVQ